MISPALKAATTPFGSATEALERALASERSVSADFQGLAKAALEEGDHTSHQFLLWFIED